MAVEEVDGQRTRRLHLVRISSQICRRIISIAERVVYFAGLLLTLEGKECQRGQEAAKEYLIRRAIGSSRHLLPQDLYVYWDLLDKELTAD